MPYGDPGEQYYRKNAFDIGEYGIGMLANSLTLGCDCLGAIRYFDAHLIDSRGEVVDPQERRLPARGGRTASCGSTPTGGPTRPRSAARAGWSISFIATVGNYEYGFYWYFYQDGSHPVRSQADRHHEHDGPGAGAEAAITAWRSPRSSTRPFHQHFFAARLDMSVDGANNSVYEVNTVGARRAGQTTRTATPSAPRRRCSRRRRQAQRSSNADSARFWRIVNPDARIAWASRWAIGSCPARTVRRSCSPTRP